MNLDQIENLLLKKKDESTLANIIISYAGLKQKIENTQSHSWYFKRALPNKREKLNDLIEEFEEFRAFYNQATIDDLLEEIRNIEDFQSVFTKEGRNVITVKCYQLAEGKKKFYTELIRLKSKTPVLESLDFYLDHPEDFLKFIE